MTLKKRENEINTSLAMVRGVAFAVKERGYKLGGLDIAVSSGVPVGSGLSSSAAFEVLIGTIFNHFFCKDELSPMEIAGIGQYAENVYFGKPCGLMDQMACAVGGIVAIDFADALKPAVRKVEYDFAKSGYTMCIVDTRSCHADLSVDYGAITGEMGAVAAQFGKKYLRDVAEDEFIAAMPKLRIACGDRAVLRALHFFHDDRRAVQEAEALEKGDFERFLTLVNDSGTSSALYLQNNWSIADPAHQAIPIALAAAKRLLSGTGVVRVHGGGFAGTIQAFVPNDRQEYFKQGMEELLGEGCCHMLHIRSMGCCVVAK